METGKVRHGDLQGSEYFEKL